MFPAACIIKQRATVIKQEALLESGQWCWLACCHATGFCLKCRASLQFSHVQKTRRGNCGSACVEAWSLSEATAGCVSGLSQGFVHHVAITRSLGAAHSLCPDADLQPEHSNKDSKIERETAPQSLSKHDQTPVIQKKKKKRFVCATVNTRNNTRPC